MNDMRVISLEENFACRYGGPGTQTVSNKWSLGWDAYLASQRNFIVANIDVRGTGYQGSEFKQAVYGQLGRLEVADTLHVIRELVDNVKYIDRDRVCVWGWSYGGYVTGMVMAAGSELVKCGIAVSPVTEWQHYDTAYTERYMGLPGHRDNWRGYTGASLTLASPGIRDSSLMVVHGSSDDNVHLEHTMSLSRHLITSQILFRQLIYPGQAHGLNGVLKHLYRSMEAFLDDVFGPIHDYFEDDYFLAAARLVEEYGLGDRVS